MFVLTKEENRVIDSIISKCELKHIEYDSSVRTKKDCGSDCKGKCGATCQAVCRSTCTALF